MLPGGNGGLLQMQELAAGLQSQTPWAAAVVVEQANHGVVLTLVNFLDGMLFEFHYHFTACHPMCLVMLLDVT